MQELVKILEDYIKGNFNEDSLKVFRQLWGKSNVSEFDIAENLKLSINYVRNLLYGLHAGNLVSSTRKKDRQKGWYIYYWTFNLKHAVGVIIARKKERVLGLENRLAKGEKEYYVCKDGHVEFNAVKALEYGFKCPECEQVLVRETGEHDVEKINAEIDILKKEIEMLEQPIEMPKEVVKKSRKKVVKKKIRKARKKLKKIKRKIKKLKKKLKKMPERKKKIARRIKKLKVKKKVIKKKIVKLKKKIVKLKKKYNKRKSSSGKKTPGKGKGGSPPVDKDVKADSGKDKEEKKGFLSLIKKRVGF